MVQHFVNCDEEAYPRVEQSETVYWGRGHPSPLDHPSSHRPEEDSNGNATMLEGKKRKYKTLPVKYLFINFNEFSVTLLKIN